MIDRAEKTGRLRELLAEHRIVYISGFFGCGKTVLLTQLAAGFSDYLSKPIDSAKLEKLLLRYLPPEKVRTPEKAERQQQSAALPGWLSRAEGLDTRAGLGHCGTPETYLDTLTIYAKNIASIADELESYLRANDAENAAIKVHALKSTSRTVGAKELGAMAEKLELAGKAGDTETLFGGLEPLLIRFRALGEQLAPLRGAGAERCDEALPLIPEEERGRVAALERAPTEYEWDQVEALLSRN